MDLLSVSVKSRTLKWLGTKIGDDWWYAINKCAYDQFHLCEIIDFRNQIKHMTWFKGVIADSPKS